MRFARIITAIVAFALIGLLPQAAANAAQPVTKASAAESSAATAVSAKAARKVGIKIVKRKSKLMLVGNVTPPRGPVIIQRATKCNVAKGVCNFKFYKKVGLKKGHYEVRVYAPKRGSWAWRARVGSTASDIWLTCKKTSATAPCATP